MATIGEFLDALKQKDNFSGNYALGLMEEAAPEDGWQATLSQELTPEMTSALFDAVASRLEEVRGYYETPDGLESIGLEIDSFIKDFGSIALQFGVEVIDSQGRV